MRIDQSSSALLKALLSLVLAAFVAAVYLPTLDAPFTFDDYPNIVSYSGVQPESWTDLADSATHPTHRDRPVARLTFGLNYLASGLDPTAYHLTNTAIHAASTIGLFLLLLALTSAPRSPDSLARNALAFAFIAALLWGVNPANTQAVSYIVQRMASLAGLFYIVTLCIFVFWRLGKLRASRALPLLLLVWGLAVGSKMSAASAPAVWWILEVAFFTGFTRRNFRIGGALLATALAGGAWILWGHLQFLVVEHPRLGFTGVERMLTECRVLWHYVSLLLWPDAGRLQVDYAYSASKGLFDPLTTLWGLLAIIVATALAFFALRRGRLVWPAAGWLMFLAASTVESGPVMLDPIFEHRLYTPGALLLPGLLAPLFCVELSPRAWTFARLGALCVVVAAANQTIERNRKWAEPSTLWAEDLAGAKPMRAAANSNVDAFARRDVDQVRSVTDRAIRLADTDSELARKINLARAHLVNGEPRAALDITSVAIEANRHHQRLAYLHGIALIRAGETNKAQELVDRFVDFAPNSVYTAQLQAYLDLERERPEAAIKRLRAWLADNTGSPLRARNMISVQLAISIERTGDPEGAAEIYRRIIRQDPQNWTAWLNLAQLYRAGGSLEQAETINEYLRTRGVRVGN